MLAHLLRRVLGATKPVTAVPLVGALADLGRSKSELVAENALLRQQLLVLRRSVKRPRCRPCLGWLVHPASYTGNLTQRVPTECCG